MNNWLNTDHVARITWYPDKHEFLVKWSTGLSITVSEELGVRALEELIHSEPHAVPPEYLTALTSIFRADFGDALVVSRVPAV